MRIPCLYRMTYSQGVPNGHGLQKCRVPANIDLVNSSRGDHLKTRHVTKCYIGPQIWMFPLVRPRQWALDMRFGTWNVGHIEVWVTEDGFKRAGEV